MKKVFYIEKSRMSGGYKSCTDIIAGKLRERRFESYKEAEDWLKNNINEIPKEYNFFEIKTAYARQ